MKIGIYAGTFDPPTLGHLDIIKRSFNMFDKFIILIMNNKSKKNLLNYETRINYMMKITKNISKSIDIKFSNNSLVDYIKKIKKDNNNIYIIRGIRNSTDFNYEYNMYLINKTLYNDFECIFLLAKNEFNFINSSTVKELLNYNLNIEKFIHKSICEDLSKEYKKLS